MSAFGVASPCCRLRLVQDRVRRVPAVLEHATPLGSGHRLIQVLLIVPMLAQFVVGGRVKGAKATR